MYPNFFLVCALCTISAFTSSKYLLVRVAEGGGRELRLNPANKENNLRLKTDHEPMNIESRGKNEKNIVKIYNFLFFILILNNHYEKFLNKTFFLDHGFPNQNHPNLEFQLEDLHKSIRPDLVKSLQKSKQLDKIKHVFDFETISKMENDIKDFVLESKKRQKGHLLPTIHQVYTNF